MRRKTLHLSTDFVEPRAVVFSVHALKDIQQAASQLGWNTQRVTTGIQRAVLRCKGNLPAKQMAFGRWYLATDGVVVLYDLTTAGMALVVSVRVPYPKEKDIT